MADFVPITPLPPAPTPSDSPAVFAGKAGTFVTAQVVMVPQANALAAWANTTAAEIVVNRDAAADSAEAAALSAEAAASVETDVSEQVAAATAAANNAAASAAAAESAPGSIGNLALIHSLTIGMMRRF